MAKLTKRMSVIRDKVDATKQYDINESYRSAERTGYC
ncbi:50S ribosomal protein L1 [Enterobacter cancerogenus]|uniref:50S ribosomal protein L1 n=1 Tax=Enterobacter cancerogenus TaxID=69218 RepID=A0A484XS00_9ENTR|nr:50S ribosomal protein L1 [Enterobacter cancerogenus]